MFAPWHNKVGEQTAFSPPSMRQPRHAPIAVATANTPGLPAGFVLSGDPASGNGVVTTASNSCPVSVSPTTSSATARPRCAAATYLYQDRLPGFFNLSHQHLSPTHHRHLANMDQTAGSPAGHSAIRTAKPPPATRQESTPTPSLHLPFKSSQVFPNQIEVNEYDPSGNFMCGHLRLQLTLEQQLPGNWATRWLCRFRIAPSICGTEVNPLSIRDRSWAVSSLPGGTSAANTRRVMNRLHVGPCLNHGCNQSYSQIVEAAMIGNAHFNSFRPLC